MNGPPADVATVRTPRRALRSRRPATVFCAPPSAGKEPTHNDPALHSGMCRLKKDGPEAATHYRDLLWTSSQSNSICVLDVKEAIKGGRHKRL
jgi:hypothetical protein